MFNTSRFGGIKFNRFEALVIPVTATASMEMGAAGSGWVLFALGGTTLIRCTTAGNASRLFWGSGTAEIESGAVLTVYHCIANVDATADMTLEGTVFTTADVEMRCVPISLEMTASGQTHYDASMESAVKFQCETVGSFIRFLYPTSPIAEMQADSSAHFGILFFPTAIANMVMTTHADTYHIYGTDQLELAGLVLRPGDEVVIDTDKMTVTVNGQNALKYLSADSDFFQIAPGDNTLTFTAQGGNKADVFILWKDRWL